MAARDDVAKTLTAMTLVEYEDVLHKLGGYEPQRAPAQGWEEWKIADIRRIIRRRYKF